MRIFGHGHPLPIERVFHRKVRCREGVELSRQSVITRTITVAAGVFAPGHLGELTQIVPFEMVDQVLADTGATQRRLRKLPARVVVYLLLAAPPEPTPTGPPSPSRCKPPATRSSKPPASSPMKSSTSSEPSAATS